MQYVRMQALDARPACTRPPRWAASFQFTKHRTYRQCRVRGNSRQKVGRLLIFSSAAQCLGQNKLVGSCCFVAFGCRVNQRAGIDSKMRRAFALHHHHEEQPAPNERQSKADLARARPCAVAIEQSPATRHRFLRPVVIPNVHRPASPVTATARFSARN